MRAIYSLFIVFSKYARSDYSWDAENVARLFRLHWTQGLWNYKKTKENFEMTVVDDKSSQLVACGWFVSLRAMTCHPSAFASANRWAFSSSCRVRLICGCVYLACNNMPILRLHLHFCKQLQTESCRRVFIYRDETNRATKPLFVSYVRLMHDARN